MTPKEKAQYLIDRMAIKFPPQSTTDFDIWRGAKLCAMVACDEIIHLMVEPEVKEYWNKVKKEIELPKQTNNEGDRPFGVHP